VRLLKGNKTSIDVELPGQGSVRPNTKVLLFEHRYLACIAGPALPWAATGSADDGQHGQRVQCRSRNENALRVGSLIRRIHQIAFGNRLEKVGRHQPFEDLIVLESQSHPQTFRARAGGKRLAGQRLRVTKLADEINALDLAQIDSDNVPRGIEQFKLTVFDELRRGNVA
jgi:hypothetical protein